MSDANDAFSKNNQRTLIKFHFLLTYWASKLLLFLQIQLAVAYPYHILSCNSNPFIHLIIMNDDLKSNLLKAMMNTSLGEEKQKTKDLKVEKRTENDKNDDTIGSTSEQGRQ